VLCRNADDQERLTGLLADWEQQQRTPPPPPTASAPAAAKALRGSRASWLIAAVILLVLATASAVVWWKPSLVAPEPLVPRAPPPIAAPAPTPSSIGNWPALNRIGAAGVVLFVFAALIRARQKKRGALLRGLVPRDAKSATMRIGVSSLALFRPGALRTALADMRRHRMQRSGDIDGQASVRATVASAGFVRLVAGERPVRPEYLLLVDLAGTDDLLGALAGLILARLREGNLAVERFDYHGDPRHLRRIDENGAPAGITDLETLRTEYPDHRMVVLSDLGSFSDPDSGRMRDWVQELRGWTEIAAMTPVPAQQWGPRERDLIRLGFGVVEATPAGVTELARLFRVDLPQERATPAGAHAAALDLRLARDPYLWVSDRPPTQAQVAGLVRDIRRALGQRTFDYLCAIAVFPTVHPKLTLALGCLLADAVGQPMLTEQALARLCRLPWLRLGRMPDWLRLALVRDLAARHEVAERVRAAWTVLLDPQHEGETTALPLEVVRQAPTGMAGLLSDLLRRRPGTTREAILLAFLDDRTLPELAVQLPGRLERLLRERLPRRDWGIAAAAVVLAVLGAIYANTIDAAMQYLQSLPASVARWALGAALIDWLGAVGSMLLALLPWLLSGIALALWYMELSRFLRRRLQYLQISFSFGSSVLLRVEAEGVRILVAMAAVLVALGQALTGSPFAPEKLSALVFAAVVLLWCTRKVQDGANRWVGVLVLLSLAFHVRGTSTIHFDLCLFPLVGWLACQYRLEEMRRLLLMAAPMMMLGLPVLQNTYATPETVPMAMVQFVFGMPLQVVTQSMPATVLALLLLAQLLAASGLSYALMCEYAQLMRWREIGLLLLPLATRVAVPSGGGILFDWDPAPLLLLLCLLAGFSKVPLGRLLLAGAVMAGGFTALTMFNVGLGGEAVPIYHGVLVYYRLTFFETCGSALVMLWLGRTLYSERFRAFRHQEAFRSREIREVIEHTSVSMWYARMGWHVPIAWLAGFLLPYLTISWRAPFAPAEMAGGPPFDEFMLPALAAATAYYFPILTVVSAGVTAVVAGIVLTLTCFNAGDSMLGYFNVSLPPVPGGLVQFGFAGIYPWSFLQAVTAGGLAIMASLSVERPQYEMATV
jgi:hypothetical protein